MAKTTKKEEYSPSIKRKVGKPAHVPTEKLRQIAYDASGYGLPHEQIAVLVGVDDTTLRIHYRKELDEGKAQAHNKVSKTLFEKAVSGDTSAMIWWSKAQLRWSETTKQEIDQTINGNLSLNIIGVAPKASSE